MDEIHILDSIARSFRRQYLHLPFSVRTDAARTGPAQLICTLFEGCLPLPSLFGEDIELDTVRRQFELYLTVECWWRPCGVTWESGMLLPIHLQTVVKLSCSGPRLQRAPLAGPHSGLVAQIVRTACLWQRTGRN